MMYTLSISRRYSTGSCKSSSTTCPSWMRGNTVSRKALGCSMISLAMKCSYPPFSAAEISQSTWWCSFSTGSSRALYTCTESAVSTAISPSSR